MRVRPAALVSTLIVDADKDWGGHKISNLGAPTVAGDALRVGDESLVDHDLLLHYVAAQHLALPAAIASVLTDHTKAVHDALAINADQVDGEHAAAIVTNARVKAFFPDTVAAILTDHDLARHPLSIIPTMDVAHIPNLDAAKITTGTFNITRIPGLSSRQVNTLASDFSTTSTTWVDTGLSITTLSTTALAIFMAQLCAVNSGATYYREFQFYNVTDTVAIGKPNRDWDSAASTEMTQPLCHAEALASKVIRIQAKTSAGTLTLRSAQSQFTVVELQR